MMHASSDLVQQLHVLTEQLSEVLSKLDNGEHASQNSRNGTAVPFLLRGRDDSSAHQLIRSTRPPLPDPRLVRRIIRQRQLRTRFLGEDLFADPAWDMLLDLVAARVEHRRVSVTSLCIASGVPPTTALRWINQMIDSGLLKRDEDEMDRRRAFITLSDSAVDAVARYFDSLGATAVSIVLLSDVVFRM
jgi:Winged helix DNA-binding domain